LEKGVTVEVLSRKGHERYEKLSEEQAKEIIQRFIEQGGKYWILDKETKQLLQQPLELDPECQIVLIPVIAGG